MCETSPTRRNFVRADPVFFRCPCTNDSSSFSSFFFRPLAAYAANWPEHPVLHAVRAAQSPVVDGDLSDAAWQKAPEFTDFTQHDPDDGKPADDADQRPHRVRRSRHLLRREDDRSAAADRAAGAARHLRPERLPLDQLDPQHDRLSGNAFTLSRPDVQVDTILYNDIGEDPSWDGVWDSAVKIVPDGWVAEVRIPYLAVAVSG